jgi:1-hydroxycarotenoid 3,4-desaturase
MAGQRVAVIGAGMGGLAAAVDLARAGLDVAVYERARHPGGKMREVMAGSAAIDGGPTVFTMRWIFEGLFADAGARLAERLDLRPADILARHAWRAGGRLDLFADIARSADAIGDFAGAEEARGYRAFCARSAGIYRTLVQPFIAAEQPSQAGLVRRVGLANLPALWRLAPFSTLWSALGDHFRDPRLRQLFGRYATYCGCSPWLAPATLMLVAHVEQDGVWYVRGGMRRTAEAMQRLAEEHGARFRFGEGVREIAVSDGRVRRLVLDGGETVEADAVVFNGDVSALAEGLLGEAARAACRGTPREARSLSAVTWCVHAPASGFPLARHNVFFAEDYADEFDAIFRRRTITQAPTAYVCAQDREDGPAEASGAAERLLVLVNAPADGDIAAMTAGEREDVARRTFALLEACGLHIGRSAGVETVTDPHGFAALFPGSGGALYGRASHGISGTFQRPGAVSAIGGLYLAGGTVHPGPGIPMAALSGRIAAARLLADRAAPHRRGWRRQPVTIPAP